MAVPPKRETILEYKVSGQFGQISAIDVATGVEVCVIVPVSCAKFDRERLVMRKLTLALQQEGIGGQDEHPKASEGAAPAPNSPPKRGFIA